MTIAGFCDTCGQNVWCDAEGNCASGHPRSAVHDFYDPETGAWIAAPGSQPASDAPSGPREAIVSEIASALAEKTGYTVTTAPNSDLVISSDAANANWGTGKKKVTYSAIMKVEEADRTVYWWEMLSEVSSGLSFGSASSETYTIAGTKRSGTTREVIVGPGGVALDYHWDYAATRQLAEEIAKRHGYRLKVVLRKKSAQR